MHVWCQKTPDMPRKSRKKHSRITKKPEIRNTPYLRLPRIVQVRLHKKTREKCVYDLPHKSRFVPSSNKTSILSGGTKAVTSPRPKRECSINSPAAKLSFIAYARGVSPSRLCIALCQAFCAAAAADTLAAALFGIVDRVDLAMVACLLETGSPSRPFFMVTVLLPLPTRTGGLYR